MALWSAFLLGFAGSLHCAGMCGPLMLALAKARPRTVRQTTGRLFYHGGRTVSYCALGLILGLVGQAAVPAGWQRWLSLLLGVALLASLVTAAQGPWPTLLARWVMRLKGFMGALLPRDTLGSQFLMGALNGLLPCGLVYVAAAGATATGHALTGAAYMALFGLGTWPMMLGLHVFGDRLPVPRRLALGRVTRTAVLLMAVLLILRGLELGIPFVSPNPATVHGGNSCH